jgi:hypothetical protein
MIKKNERSKKVAMVRTSVQLPPALLANLEGAFPSLKQSEAIRIAIERYLYMMETELVGTFNIGEKHLEAITDALEDFGPDDFRVACRAMPSLLESFFEEETAMEDGEIEHVVEFVKEATTRDRMQLLDKAILWRESAHRQKNGRRARTQPADGGNEQGE